MTDNEIIKALECLFGYVDCRECPYSPSYEFSLCQQQVAKDTLDLINRQKAEIERLKEFIVETRRCDKEIKSEARKEFAERLCEDRVSNDPVVIAAKCLLKEMVGDDK